MATPAEEIASLDRALLLDGEDVVLQRMTATAGTQTVAASVTCRGHVRSLGRGYAANELAGQTQQQDQIVILSPTEITAAGWTSGRHANEDTRIPMKGNRLVIGGRATTVQSAQPIRPANTLIRIELQVRG